MPSGVYVRTPEMNANVAKARVGKYTGENSSSWKPECHDYETRICECGCKETFVCLKRSKQKFIYGHCRIGKHFSKDTKIKISKAMIGKNLGEKNYNWKGGITSKFYSAIWTPLYKESIRERDQHTCQKCGKVWAQGKRRLSVHHIDYNKLNCNSDNLITLCVRCNIKVNSYRELWTEYFNNKMLS